MAVNPVINAAISNEITHLHRECTVQRAAYMLRCNGQRGGHMMRHHHNVVRLALGHTLHDKLLAPLMFVVIVIGGENRAFVKNLMKIIQPPLHLKHLHFWNIRPHRGKDKVRIVNADHFVVIISHVFTKHPLPRIATFGQITEMNPPDVHHLSLLLSFRGYPRNDPPPSDHCFHKLI